MSNSSSLGSQAQVLHIGVDVGSVHLDVAVEDQATVLRIANEDSAIARWLRKLPAGSRVAMESTGRYHRRLAELAHAAGMVVFVLDPRAVHHYSRGMGQRGKTDRLDAQVLARLIEREHAGLRPWQPPSRQEELLKDLIRQRASLTAAKSALQQGRQPDVAVLVDLAPLFKQFEAALRLLDRQILAAAYALPDGQAQLRKIMSVPGIGLLTGATLLRLFQRLSSRGSDAVIAFIGMDPRPADSGKRVGVRKILKRGDGYVRKLLFNAAMAAVRTSKEWRAAYDRERAKGLPTTAALVIVGRRLVRIAFSLFKAGSSYDASRLRLT